MNSKMYQSANQDDLRQKPFGIRKFGLSQVAERVEGQPMFKVLSKVKAMESRGASIIHFEIGEPDFDTPEHIVEACCDSLRSGHTHYTDSQGNRDFREAVCKHILKTRGFEPAPEQVLAVTGANSIIYYTVATVANPGDDVIISDPCFPTYTSVLKMCGMNALTVPLKEANKFCMDPEDVRKTITGRTRLIIVNSPNNPTGSVMSEAALKEIADIAYKNGVYLLCDEVYARINYTGALCYSPTILDACNEWTLLLESFSKTYAMTGWRLGICVAPQALIEKMSLMVQTIVSCTSPFIQDAGIAALSGPQNKIIDMVNKYQKRRDLLVSGLNGIEGISCLYPKGAFYAFANISGTGMADTELVNYLLEKAGVAVLPGSDFGVCGKNYIRLCYANSEENIIEGLRRIKHALSWKT
jgi:aspartate/methionine/tyrosine aminotransferase